MPALTPVPTAQVSIFSSGTSKGIAQTRGAQIVGRADVAVDGVYVAAYAKNVTATWSTGEAGAIIGFKKSVSGFQLGASATLRRAIDAAPRTDATALELAASASYRVGQVTPSLIVIYSPDDLGPGKRSVYVEGGASYAISKHLSASAAIGRRNRIIGAKYTAWNAGVTWSPIKNASFDVRYYSTDGENAWPYKPRFVVGAAFKF